MLIEFGRWQIDMPKYQYYDLSYWQVWSMGSLFFDLPSDQFDPVKIIRSIWLTESATSVYFLVHKKTGYGIITSGVYGLIPIYRYGNKIGIEPSCLTSSGETQNISAHTLKNYALYGHVFPWSTMLSGYERLSTNTIAVLLPEADSWSKIKIDITDKVFRSNNCAEEINASIALCRQRVNGNNVALALSGGVDSSLLWAKYYDLQNIFALTVETYKGRTESNTQAKVMDIYGGEQFVYRFSDVQALQYLRDMVARLPEPFGHPIAIKYAALAYAARKLGAKVLITGDGADEIWNYDTSNMDSNNFLLPIFNYPDETYSTPIQFHTSSNASYIQTVWQADIFAFGSSGNWMTLAGCAWQMGLELCLPYLHFSSLIAASNYVTKEAQHPQKRILRNTAKDILPIEIIEQVKLGFRSDAEIWFKDGVIKDTMQEWIAKWPKWLPIIYRDRCLEALEEHQKMDGKGNAWILFLWLSFLEWSKCKEVKDVI
jgi:asparagine synthetase B (glutamine-hydrolysing)